jgi:hypothetical protein
MVIFKTKKLQFGYILEGLGIDWHMYILRPFGMIYGRLVLYYIAVWYGSWSFGIFCRFGMFGPSKIWQPRF